MYVQFFYILSLFCFLTLCIDGSLKSAESFNAKLTPLYLKYLKLKTQSENMVLFYGNKIPRGMQTDGKH